MVGRIGRPHGVKGDVHVQVLTDLPEVRFAPGAVLGAPGVELTVARARWHSGRLIVGFEGVRTREDAEAVQGRLLDIGPDQAGDPGDGCWWDRDLVGLRVELPGGEPVGRVREVVHLGGQDLLAVDIAAGGEALVPFVAAVVPVVDVTGGRVVIDPPEGLLEL